jgi:hypothetical protein
MDEIIAFLEGVEVAFWSVVYGMAFIVTELYGAALDKWVHDVVI